LGNFKCKILVVLVVYEQDYLNTTAYKTLVSNSIKDVGCEISVFVYDNSLKAIKEHANTTESFFVKYCHDPANSGVSKAYNSGYQYAKELGFEWLILLDQDTALKDDSIAQYVASIKSHPEILIHAPVLKSSHTIISPSKYKYRRGFAIGDISPGIHPLGCIVPLNSGMCISINVFEKIGIYNEKIRLDFSDFDFIRRVSVKVKRFALMPVVYEHALSSNDETCKSAITRYKFYCNGARHSIITNSDVFILAAAALMRGIKLTLKFKKPAFLSIFYNQYILRKELHEI
jgi:GT2 family glycosyltransferase